MPPIDTRWAYTGLLVLVALGRLVELRVAKRNVAWVRSQGGVELGAEHYPWMVALHSSFLVACPAEVWLLDRPFVPMLAWPMLGLFLLGFGLRYWVIRTLGPRWTTRVLCVPGEQVVRRGPYRLMRHPNYVGVALELAALPLIHTAWLTALFYSAANAVLMMVRVRVEEEGLRRMSDYDAAFPV